MAPILDLWRAWASADAESRGIAALAPLVDTMAASLARLRAVDWVKELQRPASPPDEGGAR